MRRAIAPLLLALAMVSPLVAQSSATSAQATRYARMYVFDPSTAVHRIVGRKLFEEIAAQPPAGR